MSEFLPALKEHLLPFVGDIIKEEPTLYALWHTQEPNDRQYGFLTVDININHGSNIDECNDVNLISFQFIHEDMLTLRVSAVNGKYEEHLDYFDPDMLAKLESLLRGILVQSIFWATLTTKNNG